MAAFLLTLMLGACHRELPTATVVEMGPYSIVPGPPMRAEFQKVTGRISATVGTRFGVGYVISGPPKGSALGLREAWRYPEPGVPDRLTGRLRRTYERERTCTVGNECLTGYVIERGNEIAPGTWILEVWHEEQLLLRKSFEMTAG